MSDAASPPPPLSPPAVEATLMDDVMADAPTATSPKPGFTSLCHSLHDLLEAGKYREVCNATNDILTRALKLIDPITADFLRDDDDESAGTFLLFHEYLLYSITVPGWALILALERECADDTIMSQPATRTTPPRLRPQIAAQVFNFFTGAQKISNSLCRTVLANAKGRVCLVERTWKIRAMLLEETRQAIETLYGVDAEMVARAARSPFGKEAAMEPWQVLEALVPGELELQPKGSLGDLLRGWTGPTDGGNGGTS